MFRRDMRNERPDMVSQSRIGVPALGLRAGRSVSVAVSSNFEFPCLFNCCMAGERHENVVQRCAVHDELT